MKKVLICLLGLIVMFFGIFNIDAQTTGIRSINEKFSMSSSGVFFKDFSFSTFDYYDDVQIGFMGSIENKNSNFIVINVNIKYYDDARNLIASNTKDIELNGNSELYYNKHTLGEVLNVRDEDIYYYNLSFEVVSGSVDYKGEDSIVIEDDGANDLENNIGQDGSSDEPNDSNDSTIENDDKEDISRKYDYVIKSYDIVINVNDDNSYDITEVITVHFNNERHGIYRKIPLKNYISRVDGSKSINIAQISNISVDTKFINIKGDNQVTIKIGDSNKILIGEKTYTIKYTYNIGEDFINDFDEFYFNIIGSEWDTTIDNVSFTINMPKEFDSSKLDFFSGTVNSANNDNVKYEVFENKIVGKYDSTLNPGESLTIRCEVPEGYFSNAKILIDTKEYIFFIVPIFSLIISVLLWNKYGKDSKTKITTEFYPPNELNSLEIGYLYKGYADYKDVTSLLIYLANRGYIKILDSDEKDTYSKNKGFKIIKIKEYDGSNVYEKKFMNGLFRSYKKSELLDEEEVNENNDYVNEVSDNDLMNGFYITMDDILYDINSKENKSKIFESDKTKKIILPLIIISSIIILSVPSFAFGGLNGLMPVIIMYLFMMPFLMILLLPIVSRDFKIIWGCLMLFFILMIFGIDSINEAITYNYIYLIGVIVGAISIGFMIACYISIPKRTKYASEMLGKIKSFRNFLMTSKKYEIEDMVMKDPVYFYDILPYTYVLGVSNKWIKKFESISLKSPEWYYDRDIFDFPRFSKFINNTMGSAQRSMSYDSSSSSDISSGSSSSSGGFSGRGSGGGGGGSW